MISPDQEKRIKEFSQKATEAFKFLESEYGFVRKGLRRIDLDSPRDAAVVITYVGKQIGVIVGWGIPEIYVNLTELCDQDIPQRVTRYGKDKGTLPYAISLDLLVKMTIEERKGDLVPPLPEMKPYISFTEMSFMKPSKYSEMLNNKLGEVLNIFAKRLKEYGTNILQGDTSIFRRVLDYENEFRKSLWKRRERGKKASKFGDGS